MSRVCRAVSALMVQSPDFSGGAAGANESKKTFEHCGGGFVDNDFDRMVIQ